MKIAAVLTLALAAVLNIGAADACVYWCVPNRICCVESASVNTSTEALIATAETPVPAAETPVPSALRHE